MSGAQIDVTNCLRCSDADPEHEIGLDDGSVWVCASCWRDRHETGLVDYLAKAGVLTADAVADLEAGFYAATSTASETATPGLLAVREEIPRTTMLRQARAAALDGFLGLTDADAYQRFDAVRWPGADPDDQLAAAALFIPAEADVEVWLGAFIAASTVDAFDEQLRDFIDELDEVTTP